MIEYQHLIGRKFVHGVDDCYGLVRHFFLDNYQIDLPDWAREDEWWEQGEDGPNFYMKHAHDLGFRIVEDIAVRNLRVGDCPIMAIRSTVPNHAGVYVGNGEFLHHYYGQLSRVEGYKGLWRNSSTAILRHKNIPEVQDGTNQIELFDFLPDSLKRRYNDPRTAG